MELTDTKATTDTRETAKVWKCCGKAYLTLNRIMSHYTIRHPESGLTVYDIVGMHEKLPQCKTCTKIFSSQDRLEEHKMRRHGRVKGAGKGGDEPLLDTKNINNGSNDNLVQQRSVDDHTVQVLQTGPGGLSIKYTKQCPISSTIASFQQVPMRCAHNLQLRGGQLGNFPRNRTTMMLRPLPPTKKTENGDISPASKSIMKRTTKNPVKINCLHCPCKFQGKAGLSSHLRSKHGLAKTSNSSASGSPRLSEEATSTATSNVVAMDDQVEGHSSAEAPDEEETLPEESMEEGSAGDLESSIEAQEPPWDAEDVPTTERDGDEMICKLCNKRFQYRTKTHKKRFAAHMEIHYGLRPFPCPFCDAAFKTDIRLLAHASRHTEEYNFECALCSQKFKNKTKLESHNKRCKVETNCDQSPNQDAPP